MEGPRLHTPVQWETGIAWQTYRGGAIANWSVYRRISAGLRINLHRGVVTLPFSYNQQNWSELMEAYLQETDTTLSHLGWIQEEAMLLET